MQSFLRNGRNYSRRKSDNMTKRTKASIKKEVRDIDRLLALVGKSVHNEETALINIFDQWYEFKQELKARGIL